MGAKAFPGTPVSIDWERMWAPYDEATYQLVLEAITADDVVLEIGAGDFRLARRLAEIARKVYAIELDSQLVAFAREQPALHNLNIISGDAYQLPFPADATVGVLLMRHCQQYALLARKLADAGCRCLLTNARWRMSVERIDLMTDRIPYSAAPMGWYACRCGAVGFVPGAASALRPSHLKIVTEVDNCPECLPGQGFYYLN